MMSAYDRQLYTSVLNIKAWKYIYNRMIMLTLTVNSSWPCCEVFMRISFLRNDYTFEEQAMHQEKGPNNPNFSHSKISCNNLQIITV